MRLRRKMKPEEGEEASTEGAKPKGKASEADEKEVMMSPEEILEMAVNHWEISQLSERLQAHVSKVRLEGMGVCSKCRWVSGCLACDKDKAWRWAVRQELGMVQAKAKAKAKGEHMPKVKGGGAQVV